MTNYLILASAILATVAALLLFPVQGNFEVERLEALQSHHTPS